MFYESLPIPPRLFKVLYCLIFNVKIPLASADIDYLLAEDYITAKHGSGWLVNGKGRLLWRKYRKESFVHDAIIDDLPFNTILQLKACELNRSKMLNQSDIDNLIRSGYLLHTVEGNLMLTDKGHDLVRSYNRILADLK